MPKYPKQASFVRFDDRFGGNNYTFKGTCLHPFSIAVNHKEKNLLLEEQKEFAPRGANSFIKE